MVATGQLIMNHTPCPSHDDLIRLTLGNLPSGIFDQVCEHVESCENCQTRLKSIDDQPDAFTRSLAGIGEEQLNKARVELETEAARSAASIREFYDLGKPVTANQAMLNIPCQLGPYNIQRLIGEGGMGEVYEARHIRLDRMVAIKLIRGDRQADPVTLARFLKEMATTGKFDHPNLVRAYDAWEEDGCLYLALELLEGISLSDIFKQGQSLSVLEILDVMEGLSRAMEHLHTNDLVHCDIKPANILRLHNGTIKLIDYGLAFSIVADLKPRPSRAGTKGFMSPEQQSGKLSFDHRSDIYSAGCVLITMLGKLESALLHPPDSRLLSQMKTIAERMVMESPGRRYQSASELLSELQRVRQAYDTAKNSIDRKKASVKAIAAVLGLCLPLLAWQVVIRLDDRATLIVKNSQPGDVLTLTADNGKAESFELAADGKYAVPPGSYRLSLNVPDNRTLTPASLVVSNRDQTTVTINGERKPFAIKMVTIPPGRFTMGASGDEKEAEPNEFPRREIEFKKPFMMSIYEVTVSQFREFVVATGYVTYAERSGEGGWTAKKASSWGKRDKDYNWTNPGYVIADTLPVTMVTYDDATAFCKWLSQREGKTYRLPTEAEWEYACRAGTTEPTPYDPKSRDSFCWTQYNNRTTPIPRPVGIRQPNGWGLYDTIGNVREWCLD